MPLYEIVLDAECEGVATIRPRAGRYWGLRYRCTNCTEETDKYVYVDPNETQENEGGVRNSVFKCPFCKGVISTDVVERSEGFFSATDERHSNVVVKLDVRNAEPVDLKLDDQWVVESEGGAIFEEADLSEEWCEYDEAATASLSVMDVSVTFRKSKK